MIKRVLEKNRLLAANHEAADRWDTLWNDLEKLSLPTGGPEFEHFQTRRQEIQLSMNQSTNLLEIETKINALKAELLQYTGSIADDRAKLAEAFGKPPPPSNQQLFLSLLQEIPGTRRVVLPRERIPPEYVYHGFPPQLLERLQKLTQTEEMIEEINIFHAEDGFHPKYQPGTPLNDPVMSRRTVLDQEPLMQPPLQIEIAPYLPETKPVPTSATNATNLPLTPSPQGQIYHSTNGKEK